MTRKVGRVWNSPTDWIVGGSFAPNFIREISMPILLLIPLVPKVNRFTYLTTGLKYMYKFFLIRVLNSNISLYLFL